MKNEGVGMHTRFWQSASTALAIGFIAAAAWAASPAAVPWREWRVLRLHVTSIPFFSGMVEMRLSALPGGSRLETRSSARFFGARVVNSRTETVIDGVTGRTESYSSYSRKRGRRYTFGESSYVVEKLLPPEKRKQRDGRWTVRAREEFEYPKDPEGRTLEVFDYYGMLLHLRELDLDDIGEETVLHVATSRGPQPYRIRVGEIRTTTHRLTDLRYDRRSTLAVRKLRLRIIPADPELSDEGFLKMEGETELWVEAESKTPLLLSGKAPNIPGRIRLELGEIG
jgi:hypothetical protein